MKKGTSVLLLTLAVLGGLVFASCDIKNDIAKKPDSTTRKAETREFVFKSTDGGQSWRDISKGLPENLRVDRIQGNNIFANEKGLFLRVGNELYHSTPAATSPFWTKEILHNLDSSVAYGRSGMAFWGANLKKANGTDVWSPIFKIFERPGVYTSFETAGGTIFIGTDRGFFRTVNDGQTWKFVHKGSLVGHLAESEGVLVAISTRGIIRSTDNGEHWSPAISEDGVAWDVKTIKGGFAAITSSSESGTRRLSTSSDGGQTWQSVHSGLRNKVVINSLWRTWNDRPILKTLQTSVLQVGEAFFCTHPDGIFRSLDKGKTWKLLLPSLDDKSFGLFVSGNVIYAVRSKGGC